jgi:hypothetical protein
MLVDHRIKFISLISSIFFLTSCGAISIVDSPRSWGIKAGEYGSSEWKTNNQSNYPSSESIAMYCVAIAEDGLAKLNWTFAQQMESTEACVQSFVDGLS